MRFGWENRCGICGFAHAELRNHGVSCRKSQGTAAPNVPPIKMKLSASQETLFGSVKIGTYVTCILRHAAVSKADVGHLIRLPIWGNQWVWGFVAFPTLADLPLYVDPYLSVCSEVSIVMGVPQ